MSPTGQHCSVLEWRKCGVETQRGDAGREVEEGMLLPSETERA